MAAVTFEREIAIINLCKHWQVVAKAALGYDATVVTNFTVGKNYFHLVIGTSSAFLVDIESGTIYGNKGWLKVDKNKIVGNAYDPQFDAAVLVRDRFRYGRFENNSDGSLKQPIVRR